MTETKARTCPDCRVEMERGEIRDRVGRGLGAGAESPEWESDAQALTFWGFGGDNQRRSVKTWRCPQCGLLVSYAK